MKTDDDWYPSELSSQRNMFGNIDAKIDSYSAKYPHLTRDYLAKVHTMCQTFIECFDKIEQNRATGKQMTSWFKNLIDSKEIADAVPEAPVFKTFALPAGATLGLQQQCRNFANLLKNQPNYDKADGLDLMIEKGEQDSGNTNIQEAQPALKIDTGGLDGVPAFEWVKRGFDALELQYRKAGTEMWQYADKSTEKIIKFKPPVTAPGTPEKFEFRAVYILKNQRVGQWSPVYTLTIE